MRTTVFAFALLLLALTQPGFARAPKLVPDPIAAKTAGIQRIDGFIPLYWDKETGKLYMEISRLNQEFLYQISLPAGIGSNPIGLDRGQPGGRHVVFFERIGPKVLMIEPNYRYRALSSEDPERRAVDDSFTRSVHWGFKVEASNATRVLVDATDFFLRDAHDVIARLDATKQGTWSLDGSRGSIYLPRTKGFPKNTEVEALLTFNSSKPGPLVSGIAPSPKSISVRTHHSFVELPGPGFKTRRFDPRVGVYAIDFYDFSSPINEPVEKRLLTRFRLEKKDPSAAVSEPVKPIVYYLDPGTPEPIRSALLEGASWWSQAFEAAGFRNAFEVKLLPADADPMDARYNVINWVHRSTRGWSYGDAIVDPRTGEIIKGSVLLGSLRVRQDYLIGIGLIPPFGEETGPEDTTALALADPKTSAVALALDRLRQLSAHEVGHTIGLAHNFAASTYGRASVMDYPAPMVEIRDGKLDLSNAYARGIGEYDKFAIRYGYSEFPPGAAEDVELDKLVEDGIARGMLFITDEDARPAGAAHPLANLWDNGDDPIASLRHEMEVRRIAMSSFGLASIPVGTPMSQLEATFLPLYLHHRYQLEAAAKSIGGLYYSYSVKTSHGPSPAEVRRIVPSAVQRQALEAVLGAIDVDVLRIPASILDLMPPRPFGWDGGTIERFEGKTDPVFDPIGAATIAADIAIRTLLEPNRAQRTIEFHARDAANPDFSELTAALIARSWGAKRPDDAPGRAIARAVESLIVTRLIDLAANADAAAQVRAVATETLRSLSGTLETGAKGDPAETAHRRSSRDDIERFLSRPDNPRKATSPLPEPPGPPIG